MSGSPQDWSKGLPLMAGPYFVGLYQPSPETAFYWAGVELGELRLRWCSSCELALHPKRIVCTRCGNSELSITHACGKGTVYSFSEVHRAADPAYAAATPYLVGIVALAEGVFLFTRFIAGLDPIAVGDPVEVDFRVLEQGHRLPVFRARPE